MLVADIVNKVVLGMDIMKVYIVDLRENVLRLGQGKIRFCITKMTGSANHFIKEVTVAKEVNRYREDEPL